MDGERLRQQPKRLLVMSAPNRRAGVMCSALGPNGELLQPVGRPATRLRPRRSQRERKFSDKALTSEKENAMKDMISVIMLLTPEITSFIAPFNPSVCPFARAGTWAQSGCDDPQAEASPHLDPMLNT